MATRRFVYLIARWVDGLAYCRYDWICRLVDRFNPAGECVDPDCWCRDPNPIITK